MTRNIDRALVRIICGASLEPGDSAWVRVTDGLGLRTLEPGDSAWAASMLSFCTVWNFVVPHGGPSRPH